jgi:methylphosphotriester-DNA--protein-cysteine methyltransferase
MDRNAFANVILERMTERIPAMRSSGSSSPLSQLGMIITYVDRIARDGLTTVDQLAEGGQTRRTISRHFKAAGLPPAGSWIQLIRVLEVWYRMKADPTLTVGKAAMAASFNSGSDFSNMMLRTVGLRPGEAINDGHDWHSLLERWIRIERKTDRRPAKKAKKRRKARRA